MLINVHGVVAAYETNWLEDAAVVEALVLEREGSGYLSGDGVDPVAELRSPEGD